MDKVIERPRGLSRRNLFLLVAGAVLLGGMVLLIPTLRRWSSAEKSVDASRIRIGEVTRGDAFHCRFEPLRGALPGWRSIRIATGGVE